MPDPLAPDRPRVAPHVVPTPAAESAGRPAPDDVSHVVPTPPAESAGRPGPDDVSHVVPTPPAESARRPGPGDVSHVVPPPPAKGARRLAPVVAELAEAQHGVVARRQLLAAGIGSSTIGDWARDRRLIRVHRGVYAVGHDALTPNGRRMAAVLACGPGAVLSHRTAAGIWGLRPDHRTRWDVTVPRGGGRRRRAFDVHQHRLDPRDITRVAEVPVTTIARTLLDLAEVVPRDHLDRAIERAEQLRRFDARALAELLARSPGRHGCAPLRTALSAFDPRRLRTRSDFERAILPALARAGIPDPLVNEPVAGYDVDLLWPHERVVIELDSRTFHDTAVAFERDRIRDADLQALGYAVLRVTARRFEDEPSWVVARIAALLARSPRLHLVK